MRKSGPPALFLHLVPSRLALGQPAPLGPEFQINTHLTFSQDGASVAVDGSGNFVVWHSNSQDGSLAGVFGRRFGTSANCSEVDGDGLCDSEDIVVKSPLDGDTLDCSNPALIRPVIAWSEDNLQKFRIFKASDPGFATGTRVTSGSGFFSSTSYTPPKKKWKSACKKALAADPNGPVLYIKVLGVDLDVPKKDPYRMTFSQVVKVIVEP
jgi:hypothetical protein